MKKTIALILICTLMVFSLSACKSLIPSEEVKEEPAKEEIEEEKKELPEGEVDPKEWINAEELEMKNAPALTDDLMKSTLKLEVIDVFAIGKDNSDLPKYNTLFSTRPFNSVFVINITGNPYVRGRIYSIQGYIGDERVKFDSHQFHGRKDSEIFALVFPNPITRDTLSNITFKTLVEGDNGNLTVDLKVKDGINIPKNEQRIGGIYKADEKTHVLWYKDKQKEITKLASSISSTTFKLEYRLLAFGGDININRSDFKAFSEIDGKRQEIPNSLLTLTDINGEEIDKIERMGLYTVTFNKDFLNSDLQKSLVFSLLQVKNSNPMRIEVLNQ